MIITEQEARAIFDKVFALVTADQCTLTLSDSREGNVRFANNNATTSGHAEDARMVIEVAFGNRVASTTINSFDDRSLKDAVAQVEAIARIAPENPEFVPAIEPQSYHATPTYSPATAAIDPEFRSNAVAAVITACQEAGLETTGFCEDALSAVATANSKGNFGYQAVSYFSFTATVRTKDGTGSARLARALTDVQRFKPVEEIQPVISRARLSSGAQAIEPGRYTVVMAPTASVSLIAQLITATDARSADEGRSYFSRKGGGNRLGDRIVDPRVTITSDPADPDAPILPWDENGLARRKMSHIRDGKIEQLLYSPQWGRKKGIEPTPMPGNLRMEGGIRTTAELIAGTERGIYISRTWYIGLVDPQSLLLTGLTRDGTFYIEDGKIKYPLKNMRFNESPVIMLNNLDELGVVERVPPEFVTSASASYMLPSMRIREFTFSSISDAI